jgi:hypothetical protein
MAHPVREDPSVTIARRRTDAMTASLLPAPAVRVPLPGRGVPGSLGDAPVADSVTPFGRLRRCTFRRIDYVQPLPGRSVGSAYEVMCLYGGGDMPMPLGDVAAARATCEACTASGIFRPDED